MNEWTQWVRSFASTLSPLTIRAETAERFSCRNIQTHTHSHDVYTHVHVHSPTEPRVIQLGSCILLNFFLSLDSLHSFSFFYFLAPSLSPSTQWQTTTMEAWSRTKQNPFNEGCSQSVNWNPPAPAHKDIYPFDPTGSHDNSMQIRQI